MSPLDLSSPDTILTLESLRTGRKFTYRIRRAPTVIPLWHVDIVTGTRNEDAQIHIGRIEGTFYCPPTNVLDVPVHAVTAFAFYWGCPSHPQLRTTTWSNVELA